MIIPTMVYTKFLPPPKTISTFLWIVNHIKIKKNKHLMGEPI